MIAITKKANAIGMSQNKISITVARVRYFFARRKAFSITTNELNDMPKAANQGVTTPVIAKGTPIRL